MSLIKEITFGVVAGRTDEDTAAWATENVLDRPLGKTYEGSSVDPVDLLIGPPAIDDGQRAKRKIGSIASLDPLDDRAYGQARGMNISANAETVLIALRALGRPLTVTRGRAVYAGENPWTLVWNEKRCGRCQMDLSAMTLSVVHHWQAFSRATANQAHQPPPPETTGEIESKPAGMPLCPTCHDAITTNRYTSMATTMPEPAAASFDARKKAAFDTTFAGFTVADLHVKPAIGYLDGTITLPDQFVRMALPDGSMVKIMWPTFVMAARACKLNVAARLFRTFPRMLWATQGDQQCPAAGRGSP